MLGLALLTPYSTQIDQSSFGLSFGGLSLSAGWQRFGALLAGFHFGRFKGDGAGRGLQGIDPSNFAADRPNAGSNCDLDTTDLTIGMRSPLPTAAVSARFQFGFRSVFLATLGRIAEQLNLSGRCRPILSPT